MVVKICDKFRRLVWLFFHPRLWGKHVSIQGIPKISSIKNLTLGRYVSINEKVLIQCVGGVFIGDYVTISYMCTILTTGLDTNDYPNQYEKKYRAHVFDSVTIEDGVWLCTGVKVMPGVRIARGIIVGAGAVVTKDLEKEGWLYAGVPAKPIKPLFKD